VEIKMKLWERYCKSCPGKTGHSAIRNGYHEWKESKWLTNLSGFIKLNNPRYIVPKSTFPDLFDFSKYIHKSLKISDILESNFIEYNKEEKEIKRKVEYEQNKFITLNDEVLNVMFKMNNCTKFYYVVKSDYVMYLYNDECELQGMILGIR
jgi:hypothetical protein